MTDTQKFQFRRLTRLQKDILIGTATNPGEFLRLEATKRPIELLAGYGFVTVTDGQEGRLRLVLTDAGREAVELLQQSRD